MFPATLANFNIPGMQTFSAILNRGDWVFNTLFASLIIFFCFFYTAVTFQPVDVADNLKKQQANIPGIRPGKQTAEYIDRVLTRITFGGAIYVAAVCVVPAIIARSFRVPFQFGGTSPHDRRRRRARHRRTRSRRTSSRAATKGSPARAHDAARSGRRPEREARSCSAPPASGKGTQAKVLCERFGDPADLDRRHAPRGAQGAGTPLGKEADELHERGQARPGRGRHRPGRRAPATSRTPSRVSFSTDFPRTVPQAEALDALLAQPRNAARSRASKSTFRGSF